MTDEQIERVLEAYALRITDLKGDLRFKYVTVFRESRRAIRRRVDASEFPGDSDDFVPRRVLYELLPRCAWFEEKERCVFCDILRQEEKQGRRIIDSQGDYVAFCPYASRVPFEIWLMRAPTQPFV